MSLHKFIYTIYNLIKLYDFNWFFINLSVCFTFIIHLYKSFSLRETWKNTKFTFFWVITSPYNQQNNFSYANQMQNIVNVSIKIKFCKDKIHAYIVRFLNHENKVPILGVLICEHYLWFFNFNLFRIEVVDDCIILKV